jgi:SnoaL-like domain
MTTATQTRRIVRAFHDARTNGDFATAATHLAPAFSFQSPMLGFDDSTDYLASHAQFQQFVTGLDMISDLYGDDEATLVYDLRTATPAGTQRTAEHFKLEDGRIASILLIFDASEWRPLLAAAGVLRGAE